MSQPQRAFINNLSIMAEYGKISIALMLNEPSPHSLTEAIKRQAHSLGFQLVGVTTPDPPPHYAVYEGWLEAGRHGEMAYLASERARQRRADPRLILPEFRSILVLGIRYPAPEEDGDHLPTNGRVASYAWGDDYHEILADRLRQLVVFIETQAGTPVPNRWYTDTGPILERDLAQRAGLGWIGKNTCLIAPRLGSYFFLAEVLLGIDLEPDPPFIPDYCGSCTRCLEACPTACILPDRTLDASRCISYLTIELKGAIPPDLRQLMEGWVFGCDVCQQVCPWNQRFAAPEGDAAFAPRPGVQSPDLARELALTPKDFNHKFKDSPVQRTKRRGYLRNVAVALGNQRSPAAIPGLVNALLGESEPLVRQHAAWALGQIGGETASRELQLALRTEMDESVRAEIRRALKAK
jgi:epoxyqueuosine reductase